jgi:hypothetical protein
MKNAIFLTLLTFLGMNCLYSQDQDQYNKLIQEASALYQSKDYAASGQKYEEAFAALNGKGAVPDRYNAACSWALADEKEAAFKQLLRIAEAGLYSNYNHLISDPDLKSLYDDPRWEKVKELVKANKEKEEANLDKELVAILDTIYQLDQGYRMQLQEIEEKYGRQSEEMKKHWDLINETDAINLTKITKILDERGWLGADVVGREGNQTLFLVIQHADIATQEKYLPMMREAVQKGNARAGSLALLEDRVALRQGKRQIYGSQVGQDMATGEMYVLPLEDPLHVNERRAQVGLPPLEEYVSHWGMTWDAKAYLKKLPEIEAKQKNRQ